MEKFPEIADDIKFTWYSENDESPDGLEPHEISMKDVADEIRRVDEEISFRVSDDGEGGIIISDGQGFEFRATKRAENDRWLKVGRYVENVSFPHLDVPVLRTAMMDPRFTETVKKMGYDGIVQSMDGDEAVVFNSNQIKSATDNNGEFSLENPDIRYSIVKLEGFGDTPIVTVDEFLPKSIAGSERTLEQWIRVNIVEPLNSANGIELLPDAKHLAWSGYAQNANSRVKLARGRAMGILPDIVSMLHVDDEHIVAGKHGGKARIWENTISFGLPKFNKGAVSGGIGYDAVFIVKEGKSGKYTYDITSLTENKRLSDALQTNPDVFQEHGLPHAPAVENDSYSTPRRVDGDNISPEKQLSISSSSEYSGGVDSDGQFRSGFYTPTEEYSIPRLLMPYLQENPDAEALEAREYLEGQGIRVARSEDAERFLAAARSALQEDEANVAAARRSSCPARASTA